MIGLNEDLRRRELDARPVGVALVGAGQMGTDIVAEVGQMTGIRVLAVADAVLDRAVGAYEIAGRTRPPRVVSNGFSRESNEYDGPIDDEV